MAAYFCTPAGDVLHLVAGTVSAATLLREARWAVEADKRAAGLGPLDPSQYRTAVRAAHAARLRTDHGVDVPPAGGEALAPNALLDRAERAGLGRAGRVHYLLAHSGPVPLREVEEAVFTGLLGEPLSLNPVVVSGAKGLSCGE